ncbi:MAG: hypothetical protein ACRDQX_10275 [Pseudonocardiaceae bacterium]
MSTIIVIEIIAAMGVLAAVVRFAVRDTQQRSHDADPQQQPEPVDTPETPATASEAPAGAEA